MLQSRGGMLNACSELLTGAVEASFQWQDEPGAYDWKLTLNPKQRHLVRVQVTGCQRLQSGALPSSETLDVEVKLKLLCASILMQMKKIEIQMMEKSFREDGRVGAFPQGAFRAFETAYKARFA